MRKLVLGIAMSAIISITSCAQEQKQYLVDSQTFEKMITEDQGQLIDVRTASEFEEGTIDGAENIDFLKDNFSSQLDRLDKDRPVYIFCKSGGRSAKATKIFKEKGFENVYELQGGFQAWQKNK